MPKPWIADLFITMPEKKKNHLIAKQQTLARLMINWRERNEQKNKINKQSEQIGN